MCALVTGVKTCALPIFHLADENLGRGAGTRQQDRDAVGVEPLETLQKAAVIPAAIQNARPGEPAEQQEVLQHQTGRAPSRATVSQYVYISVVAGSVK